jgi:putative colanic acid biosynthesis acetyltransferase WcaF
MSVGLSGTDRRLVATNLSIANKLMRFVWQIVWLILYRCSPTPLHMWRRFLLRLFGATIARGAHPYPSCRIWAPWNLTMEENSCLAHGVICYNVSKITLREGATISQNVHLCGATHDYRSATFDLYSGEIEIGRNAWVCADAFIGPGINVADKSVINARAVLLSDTGQEEVYSGNPAKKVRMRYRNESV